MMKEKNMEINRLSWLFSACVEQYRSLNACHKKISKIPFFFHSLSFNQYIKHFHMSLNLLKQAENIWSKSIEIGRLNAKTMQSIYNIYLKRCLLQFQLCQEDINKMTYEVQYQNKNIHFDLKKRGQSLLSLLQQLEKNLLQFYQMFI